MLTTCFWVAVSAAVGAALGFSLSIWWANRNVPPR